MYSTSIFFLNLSFLLPCIVRKAIAVGQGSLIFFKQLRCFWVKLLLPTVLFACSDFDKLEIQEKMNFLLEKRKNDDPEDPKRFVSLIEIATVLNLYCSN